MSIKYNLVCLEEEHKFEGWFPSIEEFENQLASGQLICPVCDSPVKRDIMAPNIKKKSNQKKSPRAKGREKMQKLSGDQMVMGGRARNLLKQIQNHVEKNYENVGKEFAKEARKAAKGERNEEFYGEPSKKEVTDLVNEGIDLFAVPKVKDN